MKTRIRSIDAQLLEVPLRVPHSDAKVIGRRQRELGAVQVLVVAIATEDGPTGLGLGYALRAGGRALLAMIRDDLSPLLIGEDALDIPRLWDRLYWETQSVGRRGLAIQAIAPIDIGLWDLKAKVAGLPLAKLLGAWTDRVPVYNTAGGYLSTPTDELVRNAVASLESGLGGIKVKVGHPDVREDERRVAAVRQAIGPDVPLMVDANQMWDRLTAPRAVRRLSTYDLTWVEEPLSAEDLEGHAALTASLAVPIATGEMLGSVQELAGFLDRRAADILQPDVARIGGVTEFMKFVALAEHARVAIAPHFLMEVHVHLAAASKTATWVEHIPWLQCLFEEPVRVCDGYMEVPAAPGLGLTLRPDTVRQFRIA